MAKKISKMSDEEVKRELKRISGDMATAKEEANTAGKAAKLKNSEGK